LIDSCRELGPDQASLQACILEVDPADDVSVSLHISVWNVVSSLIELMRHYFLEKDVESTCWVITESFGWEQKGCLQWDGCPLTMYKTRLYVNGCVLELSASSVTPPRNGRLSACKAEFISSDCGNRIGNGLFI
jgi:hypothetical protein